MHDLAHLLGRIAAAEAERRLGRLIPCLQFDVVLVTTSAIVEIRSSAVAQRLSSSSHGRETPYSWIGDRDRPTVIGNDMWI